MTGYCEHCNCKLTDNNRCDNDIYEYLLCENCYIIFCKSG